MAGDDDTSAKIEALNAELAEVEIKAATGEEIYLVRLKFLRSKLVSLTTPKPAPLPQALRMAALNTAHNEAKAKAEENSTQKNLEGSTQVTVVPDNCPTPVRHDVSDKLAGAAPHAPSRPETKQNGGKISFRLPEDMRPMFDAKVAAAKSYQSAYIVGLIAADLRIPLDEHRLQRDWELQEAIAALAVAVNRQGNNINQMAKATNEGKPCPLTRPEISETLQQNRAAVSAIIKLASPG